jgi:hypothetical protein
MMWCYDCAAFHVCMRKKYLCDDLKQAQVEALNNYFSNEKEDQNVKNSDC